MENEIMADLAIKLATANRTLADIRHYHRKQIWPPTGKFVCVVCGGATWPCATWRMANGEQVEPR